VSEEMPVVIEKARLNLWNLTGFIIGIAVTAFGWGITYSNMQSSIHDLQVQLSTENKSRVSQLSTVDANLKEINLQLPLVSRLNEIVNDNRKAISDTNGRIDRLTEVIGNKLDNITERLSEVSADVKVVQSKLDNKPQRTNFRVR
jgi:hypothetical protein